jgi:hypothetical protein
MPWRAFYDSDDTGKAPTIWDVNRLNALAGVL